MVKHSSATVRTEKPHSTEPNESIHEHQAADPSETMNTPLNAVTRRRAMAVINNPAIDSETRALIRYGLDTNDPALSKFVRRAEAGETFGSSATDEMTQDQERKRVGECDLEVEFANLGSSDDPYIDCLEELLKLSQLDTETDAKIESLMALICRPGNEADIKTAALTILLSNLEKSPHLITTAKYLAFMRCCEMNVHQMVDEQIDRMEADLLIEKK